MRFQHRVALVTGAGSGIGQAVSVRLAGEGAAVVLCGRNGGRLERTRAACEGAGGRALPVPLDVRNEEALAGAFVRAERELGAVEVAIACHGINQLAKIEELSRSLWDEVISTNLTGAFLLAREAVRAMRPLGRGRIILVSSVSGRPGHTKFPGFAAYAASKYALTGLLEVLAAELGGSGVGSAMICPGGVDTEMFRSTLPGALASVPLESVTAAILRFADPAAAPPSGTILDLA